MGAPHLRVAHVQVVPVLVWDDGESVLPGPEVNPITVPLSVLPDLPGRIREDVAGLDVDPPEQAP